MHQHGGHNRHGHGGHQMPQGMMGLPNQQ